MCQQEGAGALRRADRQPPQSLLLPCKVGCAAGSPQESQGKGGDSSYGTRRHANQMRSLCGCLESRWHLVGAKEMSLGSNMPIQDPAVNTVTPGEALHSPPSSLQAPSLPPPHLLKLIPPRTGADGAVIGFPSLTPGQMPQFSACDSHTVASCVSMMRGPWSGPAPAVSAPSRFWHVLWGVVPG